MSRTENLVSTDWAVENLNTPGLVFVEVDEDTSAYDGGHVPGAIKISWKDDLRDKVRYDFIDKAGLEKLFSEKGIGNDDTIVLYGGNNNWFAAYAYWFFKLYGHAEVKLIDGGRKKWELEGLTLSTDAVTREPTSYSAKDADLSIRAFRDDAVAAIGAKNLVDVRSPGEFAGQLGAPAHLPQENAQRRGHVPGAINIPWSKAANEDGTFKSDTELAEIYSEAGFDDSKETIAYCRIGERSSHTWFVLSQLLGKKNVKNYDGSWLEYGSLVGVPIELGEPANA
jgi:thiosulfate/3-mercaptopyruvate sulfurtransferase